MCRSIVLVLCIGLTQALAVCSSVDGETSNDVKMHLPASSKLGVNPRLEEAIRRSMSSFPFYKFHLQPTHVSQPFSAQSLEQPHPSPSTSGEHVDEIHHKVSPQRRVTRSASWNVESADPRENFRYGEDEGNLNKIIQLLAADESTLNNGEDVIEEDESTGWTRGDRLEKRQPLDRLEEPNRWRYRMTPKWVKTSSLSKRQPLDRIDEPNHWRNRITMRLNRLR